MANPASSIDVPLSLFSGLVTELSPSDIPEGISPANNDVVFTPGAVATRPGLNRVFVTPISSLGPTSYQKSFVSASGTTYNLYLTQGDGILWVENLATNPGIVTSLWQSAGATYASSVTAENAEYIALSDGLHGVDIPLEFDGTTLSRITQDGPGAPPTVQSVALPPSTLIGSGSGSPVTITSAISSDPQFFGGHLVAYYTVTYTTATAHGLTVNEIVTVSGNSNSPFNMSGVPVSAVLSPTTFKIALLASPPAQTGTGGTVTPILSSLTRISNSVTAITSGTHSLQVGYQAQIGGVPATAVGGGITSIVLSNEDNPGIATVTTAAPHGLLPNNIVFIQGVSGTAVGTAITNVAFAGDFITITTSSDHGLSIGSEVLVAAVTTTSANGQWLVAAVPSATTFTYAFVSNVTAFSVSDSGSVTYVWPLANTNPALNYFTVQTAPSATTFTVSINYTDGSWTGGTVTFAWDGTFYVTQVLSSTSFVYQQYGPDAVSTASGTVTPYGQATPGIHQLQVSFLFENNTISPPSPSTTFIANGGQYLSISNLVTGPSNVMGRILQFTGAGGAYFYYIPVPAQVNGIQVSTATQINDNTTTNLTLDFSDNTLYVALACSIPGNNFAAQNILGPSAGMFTYGSRLLAWGNRNKVNSLINLGFEGGELIPSAPAGWNASGNTGGHINDTIRLGWAWQIIGSGSGFPEGLLTQSAATKADGSSIFAAAQPYSVRLWLQGSGLGSSDTFTVSLSSASTAFSSVVTFTNSQIPTVTAGAFLEGNFSTLPNEIPSDLLLSIQCPTLTLGAVVYVDDLEFFPTEEPYIQNEAWISYEDNLGAFDGLTGLIGPEDDTSAIMNWGVIRKTLYCVTGTGLHETTDNGQTEPSEWGVDQVADNCGAFSVASVGRNPQGIGSAGKTWMAWSGPDGAQIFTGQQPFKISQEIQSLWDAIPSANAFQCWVKNWESSKLIFFGIPTSTSMQVLALDYRNLDGEAIANNPPIHISFTGKMIASDLTRKWTVWNIPAYCGELMYRTGNIAPQMVFGCKTPAGAGNSYILNANQFVDDDFGQINASYTTYFFVSHEMEQQLQVGSHRKVYTLAAAFADGLGQWTLTPLMASLTNPGTTSPAWPLSSTQPFDQDFGINLETTRCAFTFNAQPVDPGVSVACWFKLQKLVVNMAPAPWSKVRGSMSGAF